MHAKCAPKYVTCNFLYSSWSDNAVNSDTGKKKSHFEGKCPGDAILLLCKEREGE